MTVRAAVVGCGDVATVHLAAVEQLDGARLIGIADRDPAVAERVGAEHAVPTFGDHRRLLAELEPDVVHVCTPHDQHVPVVLDCVAAGVPVLTEKPLAATLAQARRVLAAIAERPSARVGVCFQNRYNLTSVALADLLSSGRVGAVQGAVATVFWHRTPAYYRAKPWRGERRHSGGGVLINQAIHTLDLLLWLLGPAVEVRGHADTYVLDAEVDVEDIAQVVLTHPGGVRSALFATVGYAADAPVTLEIVTDQAVLRLSGDLTVNWADGRTEVVREREVVSAGRSYWGVSHAALIADFYATLNDPEPFWIGPQAGLATLEVLAQVYAQSGSTSD